MGSDDFPRLFARTGRFRYGEPREFTVSPDGRRVAYLRSENGTDPVTALRVLDVDRGRDRLVAGPDVLLGPIAYPAGRGRPGHPWRQHTGPPPQAMEAMAQRCCCFSTYGTSPRFGNNSGAPSHPLASAAGWISQALPGVAAVTPVIAAMAIATRARRSGRRASSSRPGRFGRRCSDIAC